MDNKFKKSASKFRENNIKLNNARRRTIFLEEAPAPKRVTRATTRAKKLQPKIQLRRIVTSNNNDNHNNISNIKNTIYNNNNINDNNDIINIEDTTNNISNIKNTIYNNNNINDNNDIINIEYTTNINNNNINNNNQNSIINNNNEIYYISSGNDSSDNDSSSCESESDSSSSESQSDSSSKSSSSSNKSDSNKSDSSKSNSSKEDNSDNDDNNINLNPIYDEDIITIREEDDELVLRPPTASYESDDEEPRRHGHFSCQTESSETQGLGFKRYEERITVAITVFDPNIQPENTVPNVEAIEALSQADDLEIAEVLPQLEDVVDLLQPGEMDQILQLVANCEAPPTPGRVGPIRNFTGIEPLPDEILQIIRNATGRRSVTRTVDNVRFRVRINAAGEATITR